MKGSVKEDQVGGLRGAMRTSKQQQPTKEPIYSRHRNQGMSIVRPFCDSGVKRTFMASLSIPHQSKSIHYQLARLVKSKNLFKNMLRIDKPGGKSTFWLLGNENFINEYLSRNLIRNLTHCDCVTCNESEMNKMEEKLSCWEFQLIPCKGILFCVCRLKTVDEMK